MHTAQWPTVELRRANLDGHARLERLHHCSLRVLHEILFITTGMSTLVNGKNSGPRLTSKEIQLFSSAQLAQECNLLLAHRPVLAVAEDERAGRRRAFSIFVAFHRRLLVHDVARAEGDEVARLALDGGRGDSLLGLLLLRRHRVLVVHRSGEMSGALTEVLCKGEPLFGPIFLLTTGSIRSQQIG